MTPEQYDAWYRTPRGRWIGETEYRLLRKVLAPNPGASVLEVGCGTGYFTRCLARDGLNATGIDLNYGMIRCARSQAVAGEQYMAGDGRRLPFPDGHFDSCVAITSLCFIREREQAFAEMLRVTRRRIVLGLLHRHSLLYRQKGRQGGRGAYRGAYWHTAHEARALLVRANLRPIAVRSAIYLPGGGVAARCVERIVPQGLIIGGFLLAVGSLP